MTDISEIKIAIDVSNRKMYEAFSDGKFDVALEHAKAIVILGLDAQPAIDKGKYVKRRAD